ncbi:MAG: hypothetical protein ACI4ES_08880 [Roseburia sp.]
MKQQHSKSSIFLMEIILDIFLFSILLTVCLQLFSKSDSLSAKSGRLEHAVLCCTSIAETFQSAADGKSALLEAYPDSTNLDNGLLIYFDDSFTECHMSAATYKAIVELDQKTPSTIQISFYSLNGNEAIYTLSASNYIRQNLSTLTGGSDEN